MSHGFGLIIESLVAILLMVTIGYCYMLDKRLKRFKADEQSLKATISELITATEIAERAIAGLKLTVRDCDENMGERLRTAERFAAEMDTQIAAGETVLGKLGQIAALMRPGSQGAAAPMPATATPAALAPDARDLVAAANAIAERSRSRLTGIAA